MSLQAVRQANIEQINPKYPVYLERCQNNDLENPPNVVIMFGWTNSSLHHVSKCASYWRQKGNFHIFYSTFFIWPYVYFPSAMMKAFENLIPFLRAFKVLDDPGSNNERSDISRPCLIGHVFSNGGSGALSALMRLCGKQGFELKFDALILDSSPGRQYFLFHYNLYIQMVNNPLKKALVAILVELLIITGVPPLGLYQYATDKLTLFNLFHYALLNENGTKCPRLFIYSKADKFVPYKVVKKFVNKSIEEGIVTDELTFENAPHVRLWVENTEVYERKVDQFLKQNDILNIKSRI